MNYLVRGFKESMEGDFREPVFYKSCSGQRERDEAVEEAFLNDADMVLVEKIHKATEVARQNG